jgi:hypothetical protein
VWSYLNDRLHSEWPFQSGQVHTSIRRRSTPALKSRGN